MLLGKSSHYRKILAHDSADARLALGGLHLLLVLPMLMIFTRTGAEIAAGALVLLFLIHSQRTCNWSWLAKAPIIFALLLWAYSAFVVTPLAMDVALSARRIDWIRFIFLFAAIVYWLSDYHEELRRIAWIILGALVLASADGVYQYITGSSLAGVPYYENRLTGSLARPVLGIFITKLGLPCIGMLLYYAWREGNRRQLMLLLAAGVYLFTVTLLSNERTATLTLALAILLVCMGLVRCVKSARVPVLVLCMSLVGIVVFTFYVQPRMQQRVAISKEMLRDFSSSPYAQLWKASLLIWKEHPITGVGMVNFRVACPPLMEQGKVTFCSNHSHNIYLELLSEFGTLGLTLLLMFIMSLVVFVVQQHSANPRQHLALTLFAFATLLVTFFPLAATQSFFSNWPALLAWQSIAWGLAMVRGADKQHD